MNVLGVVAEEQFVSYALTCIFKQFFWQEQVTFFIKFWCSILCAQVTQWVWGVFFLIPLGHWNCNPHLQMSLLSEYIIVIPSQSVFALTS